MNAVHTLLITGNIASGKSTLAEGLHAAMPQLHLVCLDRIRLEIADSLTMLSAYEQERHAEARLLGLLMGSDPVIYESTGATMIFQRACRLMASTRKGSTVSIRTVCGHDTSMRRFEARKRSGHRQIPPPHKDRLSVSQCWYRFADTPPHRADLVIDTEMLGPEEALVKALEKIVELQEMEHGK